MECQENLALVDVFSDKLKKARELNGLTQTELADKAGVALTTVESYERKKDKKKPNLETALKIAKVLGVSIDWLCGYEAPTTEDAALALLTVLKKFKPIVEHATMNRDGEEYKAATLVFDYYAGPIRVEGHEPGEYEYWSADNNGPMIRFFDEFLSIQNVERQKLLPEELIKALEDKLLANYSFFSEGNWAVVKN